MLTVPIFGWTVEATASNATAAATRNAEGASRHFITGLEVLYTAAVAATVMHTLTYTPEGGVLTVLHFPVNEVLSLAEFQFAYPLKCSPNTAVTWTAGASGTGGVSGYAKLSGFTG